MQKIYIETSIVSYLTARPSSNIMAAAWQLATRAWWHQHRPQFDVYASDLVVAEAAEGDAEASTRRMDALTGLILLASDNRALELSELFLERRVVPQDAGADALHMAIAAVNGMDYLMTWNCRHINHFAVKPLIRSLCREAGYVSPEICTPLEWMENTVYER